MQTEPKVCFRLPAEIKEWLEQDAARNDRSMNGQVVALLRERMQGQRGENQNREAERI
jgi:hypothetical protein